MGIDTAGFWKRLQELYPGKNAPEIAKEIGRTKQTVYRWRDGEMPGLDVLAPLSESHGVSLHWLVMGQGLKDLNGTVPLEPGQVPIYLGPYEQEKVRDIAAAEGKTFEVKVRDFVIDELKKRGLIETEIRSNVMFFGEPVRAVTLPLMGWVAAGEPIHVVEQQKEVRIPDFFMKHGKNHFVLHVRGDSMVEDNIPDDSLIVCEARKTAENGEKVVAVIDGERTTVKRIYREGERIRLQPANPLHQPIYVEPHQQLDIQGVVVAVFQQFKGQGE
jgi:repressor LexA